ncbi:MAG: CRISPR-associated protein Csx15 [Chloroflexota bacterium]|nr:CRISPR-associated protein Csx15 [Chloroflexota bacterium]
MLLLNFAHPLTDDQVQQVAGLLGATPTVQTVPTQIDRTQPLGATALALAAATGLTGQAWQTQTLIVNLPGLAPLAAALLAEIHGRCGYFPPVLNIRPVAGALPPRYEVAEIVNLQALRDQARTRRQSPA